MQGKVPPMFICAQKTIPLRNKRGVALVIVLAILVLITGLVLAFFSSVTNELTAAKSYAGGSSGKQLADAATQLAIGTIRKATSQTKDGSGTDIAWASQPGMIRTWDNNGNALTCYKLFSSDNLEASAPYRNTNDSSDFNKDFNRSPALFTDLNAPVLDASNTPHYPVVDPRAALDASETKLSSPQVQGFSIDTANVPTVNNPTVAYAPMPVRWMYVLQDGTLSVPTSGTTTATFPATGPNAPTQVNPIVGRIAYWTDDDSCKVNINTASEGVYWDVPHLLTSEDVGLWRGSGQIPSTPGLSICQPASGEYQRYPGHPATTSLSPILAYGSNPLLPTLTVPTPTASSPVVAINSSNSTNFETYYDLVPRIKWGGSDAGTIIPSTNGRLGAITADTDRLFASVDEFLFQQPAGTDSARQIYPNVLSSSGANVAAAGVTQALEKSKFFLTAHSSAPEVTTFNTPRISMWPVWNTSSKRTVLDSTLAFCADLQSGGTDKPFYFVRSNPRSTTKDYSDNPQNIALYNYLLKLMSLPVPGFGGAFNSTNSLDIDSTQVITSIFDYIRCINMHDTSTGASFFVPNVMIGSATWGGGEVLPISIGNTQGFGRFATVAGMDIAFCGVQANGASDNVTTRVQAMLVPTLFSPMQGLPGMFPKMYYTITGQENFTVNGTHIFLPGGKNYIANPPVQHNLGRGMGGMISPLASLERNGNFLGDPGAGKDVKAGDNTAVTNPSSSSGFYPFASSYTDSSGTSPNVPLLSSASTMDFVGGLLTVQLIGIDANNQDVPLQTIRITIPNAHSLPVPHVSTSGTFFASSSSGASASYTMNRTTFNLKDDVVRGVEVGGVETNTSDPVSSAPNTTAGDVRMVAALRTVSEDHYHAHQNWASSAMAATGVEDDDGSNGNLLGNQADSTTNVLAPQNDNQYSAIGSHGVLAASINPRGGGNNSYQYKSPYVPSRTSLQTGTSQTSASQTGVTRKDGGPGDWDTGFALLPDGAYINMGDIGDGVYIDQVIGGGNFTNQPRYPYVQKEDHFNSDFGAGSYFSPNRQVPSSMVLGSIPTGVQRRLPWQTLLFNPKPEDQSHPGRWQVGNAPPDHLVADLFWMPIVQPYPISQPFSTAGKINMNYQIEPFNYITRASGIYAVMKATKMMAIPASIYSKGHDPKALIGALNDINQNGVVLTTPPAPDKAFRYPIDVDATLGGFNDKFTNQNDIFRSASQIAELNLVPLGAPGNLSYNNSSMATFWASHTMTGDNLREKPYVDLYPRLTTKSNAYTVHFRVQVLQKAPDPIQNQWVEGKDQVVSEYRGSSEIERYLDSSASNLPDFASLMANSPTDPRLNLDRYYRFRVVNTKRFSPY